MKLNNKGFSMVEILAVVVLLGILASIAIFGVSRYKTKAINDDYEALAKSSYNAMQEYIMANPYETEANIGKLEEQRFLSNRKDPASKEADCEGAVVYESKSGTAGSMDEGKYTVYLCCPSYKKKYTFPGGKVENITDDTYCEVSGEPDTPEPPTPPGPTTVTCSAGKYLPKNTTSCATCTSGNYCKGGTWTTSTTKDQGLTACPEGYKNSPAGSTKIDQCYMKVPKNKYVKKAKDKVSTACSSGQLRDAHNVNYGDVSSCNGKSITVTFNCNGGNGGGTQSFTSDKTGQRFNNPCTRVGYSQEGWKRNKNGTTSNYSTNSGVLENFVLTYSPKITLYAHWKIITVKCNAGNYLKKSSTSCTKCPANYYCPGGTFNFNTGSNQGINKCSEKATGYPYSNAGSDEIKDCYMKVPEDNYIKIAHAKKPTKCPSGQLKEPHDVNYGKISSCGAKSITVTFDCNGGTRSGSSSATYKSDVKGQKFTTSCSKTGYTQDGWKRNKNGTISNYSTNSNVSENFVLTYSPKITIYAHWKINSYKCNAGNYLKKGSTSCTKCPANYYCPGGTFNFNTSSDQGINKCSEKATGYPYSNAGSDEINDCYMKVPEDNYIKTAHAKKPTKCPSGQLNDPHDVKYGKISSCTNKTIVVTFDCKAGTRSGPASSTYKSDVTGQKFTTSCSRKGYTQDGWKRDKNGTSSNYTTNSNISENFVLKYSPKITIYVHWKTNSYKCNAGNYLKKGETSCTKCPANYYCPGGTFYYNTSSNQGINKCSEKATGYPYSNAGSDEIKDCYMKVPEDNYVKTANAKTPTKCPTGQYKDEHNVKYGNVSSCGSKSITVTFDCNGGTGGGIQTFKSDVTGQKFNTTCTRTGYTLDGWKKNKASVANNYTTNNAVSENWIINNQPKITLYAHWKIKNYTLKFNKNGGSGTCNNITRNYNTAWGTLCTPTKKYYIFDGWYNGSEKITSTTKATKDITVKAKWLEPYINQNGTPYTHLQTAINEGSTTIKLQRKYVDDETSNFNQNRNITFDLQGNELTLSKAAINVSKGNIILRNGTIITSNDSRYGISITGGTLNLNTSTDNSKDIIIYNRYISTKELGTEAVKVSGKGKLNIYNKATLHSGAGDKSSYARVMDLKDKAKVRMYGGTLISDARKKWGGTVINADDNSTIIISGGKLVDEYLSDGRCVLCSWGNSKFKLTGTAKVNIKKAKKRKNGKLGWVMVPNGGIICYKDKSQFEYEKNIKVCYLNQDMTNCIKKGYDIQWLPKGDHKKIVKISGNKSKCDF